MNNESFMSDGLYADEPRSLEETVHELNTWYEQVFPHLQTLSVRIYDNHNGNSNRTVGHESLVTFFLHLFNMTMTPTYVLQFSDQEGVHSGIEALGRAHAMYADRIVMLQIALTNYDENCPLLGDTGDQARNQAHYDHPSTNADHIRQFHRLQGIGELAQRHLMTFTGSMNLIDDQLFGQGIQRDGQYSWLTMQSTYFRMYGKAYNALQMVELYIGNLLIQEKLRISGDWIYEPCLVTETRPIVWYNDDPVNGIPRKEYLCEICGKPESEHAYVEPYDDKGHVIYQLLPSNRRTNHAFKRMVRPLEGSPKKFTGTFQRKCSVEEYVRIKTSQRVHMRMWTLRTTCSVQTIVENLKKSIGGDVPLHTTLAARAYNDGQLNCKTNKWHRNRCGCHNFMSVDALGFEIQSIDNIGEQRRSTGVFEVNPEVVPEYVPDDNAPTQCPNCGACSQPFSDSAALYTDIYMDYDATLAKMAGNYHPMYIEVEKWWTKTMVDVYTENMTQEAIEDLLNDYESTIDFTTENWRESALNVLQQHGEFLLGIQSTADVSFFDRVNEILVPSCERSKNYCCTVCQKYINHPDHLPQCVYEPSSVNFDICEKCGEGPNHPTHLPTCRKCVIAPLFENMIVNPDGICFRCGRDYEGCQCPGVGFFPHQMKSGAEENIETAYDTIFLNNIQQIPFEAYHFVVAMAGRTLGEFVGDNVDNIQGCVLLHGPKRTGKSEFLIALSGWFPPDKRGDIPDSAEEQWWSAHLIDPVTHKTVKLVTCMELSHKCKVPMTEWQKMCDGGDLTICIKHQTARTVNVDFMAWFASNFLPFKGAMSRRAISIYLKHSIPEQFLDSTLRDRMAQDTAKQQLKSIYAYHALIQKYDKPILNQVWPLYFKKQQIEMENTSQPLCAFLRDLANHTRGGWHVVESTTDALRTQRMKNYVPISKLQWYFQKWCSSNGMSSRWDRIQWREAMDMYKLTEKNRTLDWYESGSQVPERIKRDYVFGILDPTQPTQPGAGVATVDDMDDLDDEEDEQSDMDIAESIKINGLSLQQAVNSTDTLGVMRGLNNVLSPNLVEWLWKNGVEDRRQLVSTRTRSIKTRMVQSLVNMIQMSGIANEVVEELTREEESDGGSSRSSRRRKKRRS